MDTTIKVQLKQAVKTENEWASSDIVIPNGCLAISSDKENTYKVGNGVDKWSELEYAKAEASDVYSWAKESNKPTYSWEEIMEKPIEFTPIPHKHSSVLDVTTGQETTFAYSKPDFTPNYFAVWNGFELRCLVKRDVCDVIEAAPKNHSHNIIQKTEPDNQNDGDLWLMEV